MPPWTPSPLASIPQCPRPLEVLSGPVCPRGDWLPLLILKPQPSIISTPRPQTIWATWSLVCWLANSQYGPMLPREKHKTIIVPRLACVLCEKKQYTAFVFKRKITETKNFQFTHFWIDRKKSKHYFPNLCSLGSLLLLYLCKNMSQISPIKARSIIKCKLCLQRITEDQVLAYCEE